MSEKALDSGGSLLQSTVYCVPSLCSPVDAGELQRQYPGCDASNIYDEEVNQSDIENSDDEKEAMRKKKRSRKNLQSTVKDDRSEFSYSLKDPSGPVTFDDYVPLKRTSRQHGAADDISEKTYHP